MADTIALPMPTDARDLARVQHTRLRRRMLYGEHEDDVRRVVREEHGPTKAAVWGTPDLSANPYLALWSQIAVLHAAEPEVTAPRGSEPVVEAVASSGWWTLAQRVERDAHALREMLVRVDIDPETAEIQVRPVFPDMVEAASTRRKPSIPVKLDEWVEDPVYGWIRYRIDVSDPALPAYTVEGPDGAEITSEVLGGSFSGAAYPYVDSQSRPYNPYVLIHAAGTPWLWDPYTMREVVDGSLRLCVYLTWWGHVMYNASYALRWAMNAEPDGADVVDEETGQTIARKEVQADPAVLLKLRQMDGTSGQPQVGQFSSPMDPEAILRSIAMYERRILTLAGLSAPDVTRAEADIRSGYSLVVAREAIREVQRQHEPQFRAADQEILATAAKLLNRTTGSSYSEDPRSYHVAYQGLTRTPAETRAELDKIQAEIAMGVASPVDAWLALNPGFSRAHAIEAMRQTRTEAADVAGMATGAGGGTGAAQDAALNGAQIQGIIGILQARSTGLLDARGAITMVRLAVPTIAEDVATTLVAGVQPATSVTTSP